MIFSIIEFYRRVEDENFRAPLFFCSEECSVSYSTHISLLNKLKEGTQLDHWSGKQRNNKSECANCCVTLVYEEA